MILASFAKLGISLDGHFPLQLFVVMTTGAVAAQNGRDVLLVTNRRGRLCAKHGGQQQEKEGGTHGSLVLKKKFPAGKKRPVDVLNDEALVLRLGFGEQF